MKIGVIIALLLAALSGAFLGGYKVRATKCEGDAALIALAASTAASAASKEATLAIGRIKVNHTTVKQEVLRETIEKPVYRDCKHEPSVMRGINSALSGKPVGGNSVPSTNPSD